MEFEALRGLPVRYSEFDGNTNAAGPDAEIVTNNHIAWDVDAANPERNQRLAAKEPAGRARLHDPETVLSLWTSESMAHDETYEPLELDEVRQFRPYVGQVARLNGPFETFVNAQYLRILQLVVDFDKVRGFKPKRALHVMRDGELVALLMPRRMNHWEIGDTIQLEEARHG